MKVRMVGYFNDTVEMIKCFEFQIDGKPTVWRVEIPHHLMSLSAYRRARKSAARQLEMRQ